MLKPVWMITIATFLMSGATAGQEPALATVAEAESIYADLNDASSIIEAIDSGLFSEYRGKDRTGWHKELEAKRERLAKVLPGLSPQRLMHGDARVLGILKSRLGSFTAGPSAAQGKSRCSDAQRKDLAREALSAALDACFTEIANNLEFEGSRIDRVAALGKLADLDDPRRRHSLFLSFVPLWTAINGANEPDSPYRRLIAMASSEAREKGGNGSAAVDAAAHTVGVHPGEVEGWLVRILEAWRTSTAGTTFEPWDYRHASGAADRALAGKVPLTAMLGIDHRFYRDLGADLDALGVLYDLSPRPDKSSVAYTDFLVHGRWVSGAWQPSIAHVLATFREGSLGVLNELVHENGHAVHISAIRNRPAYVDWNDELFIEAFGDVSSWSVYEPAWQRHYLGAEASQRDSLRALFGNVILDVAWSLFEIRMLSAPTADPNAVWTQITHQYLHIVPHPELSWWAVRGQLVEVPGYMVNYGLGSVLTADLRDRIRERIGPFDTGNPRWGPFVSENLLRFGSEVDTPQLLRRFLGRPVTAQALLRQIRRIDTPTTR